MATPPHSADTMSKAIALSSPSGHMSKRARLAAQERLSLALFGPGGLERPTCKQPTEKEYLLRHAQMLRSMTREGKPRKFIKEAEQCEAKANSL